VQAGDAGERFVQDRTKAGFGWCSCCTFVLHRLRRVRTRPLACKVRPICPVLSLTWVSANPGVGCPLQEQNYRALNRQDVARRPPCAPSLPSAWPWPAQKTLIVTCWSRSSAAIGARNATRTQPDTVGPPPGSDVYCSAAKMCLAARETADMPHRQVRQCSSVSA
jgi:hypothetical protein